MTDNEKAALLQFLGVTHAQAKQTDQMIVGQSQFLRPVSNNIEQHFTRALNTPTLPADQVYVNTPPPEAHAYQPTQTNHEVHSDQYEFQFDPPTTEVTREGSIITTNEIVEQLKEINLNLVNIASILKESNVKTKTKNTIKS